MTAQPAVVPPPPTPEAVPSRRWRTVVLSALSGLLLVGAFPHLDWGWLTWFALVPFLATFPHRRMRGAIGAGAVLGLVYFGGVWYWMAIFAGHVLGRPLGVVLWIGAALAQTATMLVVAVGTQWLSRRPGRVPWFLGVPALWTVCEWARQFGPLGTGWGDLAYTQHAALLPLQLVKLTGVFGLSFLIVLVNTALCAIFRPSPSAKPHSPAVSGPSPAQRGHPPGRQCLGWRSRGGGLVLALLVAVLLYGAVALHTEHLRPSFAAAALQADIDENVPWRGARPTDPAYTRRVMDTFAAQSRDAAAHGAWLVVWPETAFPGYLTTDFELRAEAAADAVQNNQAALIGGMEYDPAAQKDANTLFLVTPGGTVAGEYRKQRLVPFGEYVPYRQWLPFLDALHLAVFDMEPGDARQPVLDAGPPVGKIGAAICYDSTDGEIVRRQVARGADLLVVATDDTWFGRTAAARQHAAMAAVRAAEDDRYLVRCAATGISQVIAPTGQVLTEADLFTRKVVLAPVQPRHGLTPYARWGDWFVAVCGLGLLCITVLSGRDRLAGNARSSAR